MGLICRDYGNEQIGYVILCLLRQLSILVYVKEIENWFEWSGLVVFGSWFGTRDSRSGE